MNTKRFKIAGLIALSLVLMVTMAACDTAETPVDEDVTAEYNVNVAVVDEDGGAVEGATVELGDLDETTDAQGAVTFDDVKEGDYALAVTKDGYTANSEDVGTVTVDADNTSFSVEMIADEEPVEELTVESVTAIDETTLSVKFEEMDEAVEVELDEALVDGQEEVTFTYEGKEYTAILEVPFGSTTITGTLDSVTGEGENVVVEIDEEEYPVSKSYPGAGRYLAQIDSQVYGSNLTVNLVNGEVAGIETIELVEDIDHIAFNTVVNPTYPEFGPDTGVVRGIEVIGADTSTTVVASASAQSGVSGSTVNIAMDRISVSGIDFDVATLNIGPDGVYDGSYITVADSSVVGDINVDSYDSDISLSTVEGKVDVIGDKVELSADSVVGNVDVNGSDAEVTVAETIEGDVEIFTGAEDAIVTADVIDGSLDIQEIGSTITTSEVTGSVTLDAAADLSGIAEVQGKLLIDAADVVVSEIDVAGELEIDGNNAEISDSSFGALSDNNDGEYATLDTVTFDTMYNELTGNNDQELDGDTYTTFNVNREGWSFKDMSWPVEDETLDIAVTINEASVSFENAVFTDTVTANGNTVSLVNSEFEGLTLDSTDAVVDGTSISGALNINTAAEIKNVEIAGENAVVNTIVADTTFENVVFNYDNATPVEVNVDGVSFTDSTFKDTVAVDVDDLNTADWSTTFNNVVFEETASLNIGATAMNADSLVDINGATFGGEVATDFAGAGRIDVTDAEFAYDSDNPENIKLDDGSLSIYFDNNTIYRPVTVTDANTARFRDGTKLYNDLTGTAGDVRVIDSEFISDEAITITADLSSPSLSLNSVDFTGTEDVTMTGNGEVTFIGAVNGGDLLTVDTTTVNVTTQSVVKNTVFDVALSSVEDIVTLEGVTLNSGLTTGAADLTLTEVESGAALDLSGANAQLDTVDVDGTLDLSGANAQLDTVDVDGTLDLSGADAEADSVDTTGDVTVSGADAVISSLTTDTANLSITAAGADLTDVEVNGALNIADGQEFTDGTTTLSSVDVTGAVTIGDGTTPIPADEIFDVTWSGGTVEGALAVDVDASDAEASSAITFDGVDFTLTGGTTFTPTNADVLNINNGTVEDLSVAATTAINSSFTFDGVTFTNNDVTIDADAAVADYVDIVIDEVALTVSDGTADVTVAGGTITVLDGSSFNSLTVKDTVLRDFLPTTGTNDIQFAATFENNTFENAITDVTLAATFEGNTFEDAVTLSTDTAASFDGDTFEATLTIANPSATFTDIVNESADTGTTTVNVDESVTIDGWTLVETGSGVLEAVVASDKVLTLENDIDWTEAPAFTIDASASGANVNDNNATWIPEIVEILSIQ